MRHFKLVASSVSGLRNKVFHKQSNETLPETSWPAGRADELVDQGFIEEVFPQGNAELKNGESKEEIIEVSLAAAEALEENANTDLEPKEVDSTESVSDESKEKNTEAESSSTEGAESKNTDEATVPAFKLSPVVEIADITKANIINELTAARIEFNANSNKITLYELWANSPR